MAVSTPAHPLNVRRVDAGPRLATRVRRIATMAALVVLLAALFSYVHTMLAPSNSSLGIRTVEWLRDHGAAGLVAKVETVYYEWTAPAKGGQGLKAVPIEGYGLAGGRGAGRASAAALVGAGLRPARVHAMLHPALTGEGVWRATRSSLASEPPVMITTLRDQPEYPRVVAGLAWIDPHHTILALHPGRREPSVNVPRGPMEVPASARSRLLATFNSGFKLSDSHGGFVVGGSTYAAMRNGQGTLVGYKNGTVDVIDWKYGLLAPSDVSFARQNLPLIVSEGKPNPSLANGGQWGATVGNAVLVWRSGIGVDRYGNLIYAAGPEQTVASLARLLMRAGAVRAMELDINSYWVSFITYGAPGALDPRNLLSGIERPDTRYLEPDDRDFFTVYSR